MLILLLPITTLCVAILGFYVWHRQLARKRQFEVADAALSAFHRAEAALSYARNPANFVNEGKSRTRGDSESPAESELLDGLFIPVERLRRHSDAFDELERLAFAVEVHFGEAVARQVRAPLRTYNKIVMATSFRMGLAGMSGHDCDRLRQRLKAVVYSTGAVGHLVDAAWPAADELEVELMTAKSEVDAALRPWLTTPTLSEFLLLGNLRASVQRRVGHLTTALRCRQPNGYGKIAVYAQFPLPDDTQYRIHN
jgi:hypothetical protein